MKSYLPFSPSNSLIRECHLSENKTHMSQLKLTSQKGKVLIKAKRIFAVSLILRSDLSSGHLRRDLSSGHLRRDLSSGHLRRDLSSGLKPLMG